MTRVVIIGAGGLGKEVLEIFRKQGDVHVSGFADDNEDLQGVEIAHGASVDSTTKGIRCGDVIIAIGSNGTRKVLAERLDGDVHRDFINAIHPSAILPKGWYPQGQGVIIGAGAIITESSVQVGNHVHIDAGCVVSHDVVLKDYVRLNPRVSVNGQCVIEEGALIGAGAVIRNGLKVGAWSRVGMGSVVIKDVAARTTVFGNHATVRENRQC